MGSLSFLCDNPESEPGAWTLSVLPSPHRCRPREATNVTSSAADEADEGGARLVVHGPELVGDALADLC